MVMDGSSIEVVNLKEVQNYLDRFSDETFEDAKEVFKEAVLDAANTVKGNFGTKLQTRSGSLRRSIQQQVSGTDLESLSASIFGARFAGGQELVYTLTQEFGATITAKNKYMGVPGGPYLNIPLSANKTPAGVTRFGAREVFAAGGYIAGRAVFSKAGTAMFALVKQVRVPASLGMREAADDEIPTILSKLKRVIGDY